MSAAMAVMSACVVGVEGAVGSVALALLLRASVAADWLSVPASNTRSAMRCQSHTKPTSTSAVCAPSKARTVMAERGGSHL